MRQALIILRGPSGCGKSKLGAELRLRCETSVYSTDDFVDYRLPWAPQVDGAHQKCVLAVVQNFALYADIPSVARHITVVDNTNTTVRDVMPYIAAARALNIPVGTFRFNLTPTELVKAWERNRHKVPFEVVAQQWARLQKEPLPGELGVELDMPLDFTVEQVDYLRGNMLQALRS